MRNTNCRQISHLVKYYQSSTGIYSKETDNFINNGVSYMLNETIRGLLFLYQNHFVRVDVENGEIIEGVMSEMSAESVTVDNRKIILEEIEDLRYVGVLTDYHTYGMTGIIDNVYSFNIEKDSSAGLFEKIRYQEYECRVSCHFQIQDNAIKACDVLLLDEVHAINKEILTQEEFLYVLRDGSCRIGKMVEQTGVSDTYMLIHNGREMGLIQVGDIADITRVPTINTTLTVVTKDGQEFKGLVSAVQENSFNLFTEIQPKTILFSEIEQLRYYGKITDGKGMIDEKYRCKFPYYLKNEKDETRFTLGAKVSYAVGINTRGQIAKDVIIEEPEAGSIQAEEKLGIILLLDKYGGYIGNKFVAKSCGEGERGFVRFSKEQLPFVCSYDKGIYVVKYTLAEEAKDGKPATLARMELVKEYNYQKYGIVQINENGDIESIPLFQAGIKYYKLKDVDVICKDGRVCSGVLEDYDEQGIELQNRNKDVSAKEHIAFSEIETIKIIGRVSTYYASNGMGWIENAYFFHINELQETSDANKVGENTLLSFELRNTRKGNGFDCTNIEVIHKENILEETAEQHVAEAENNDTSSSSKEEICKGYIEAYYKDREYGYIIPEEFYGKSTREEREAKGIDVYFSSKVLENQAEILDTYKFIYYVSYTLNHEVKGRKAPALFIKILDKKEKAVRSVQTSAQIRAVEIVEKAPQMLSGENFFYKTDDDRFAVAECKEISDGEILTMSGQCLDMENAEIYRFGLLTGFDASFEVGYINGKLRFDLSDMEKKTYNIVKTAKKKMLVAYTCKNSYVAGVERIPQEVMDALEWNAGAVTDFVALDTEKYLVVNGNIKHYLSVLSDGWINRLAASVVKRKVYIRQIMCPDWTGEESRLIKLAADVHCEKENAVIQYDAVQDRYMAYRNNTHFVPVEGNRGILAGMIEQETIVCFKPKENNVLAAYIMNDNGEISQESSVREEYMAMENSTAVLDSELAKICFSQVNLRELAPKTVKLDESGWPVSEEYMAQLFIYLCNLRQAKAEDLIAAVAVGLRIPEAKRSELWKQTTFRDIRSLEGVLQLALKRKSNQIAWNRDGLVGEYSYYALTLLRGSQGRNAAFENLYRFFVQDFYKRDEMGDKVRKILAEERSTKKAGYDQIKENLKQFFAKDGLNCNKKQLAAHIAALDETSFETVCEIIGEQDMLFETAQGLLKEMDESQSCSNVKECLVKLKEKYRTNKSRFMNDFTDVSGDICKNVENLLYTISQSFVKLFDDYDAQRFEKLQSCCRKVTSSRANYSFAKRESALNEEYRWLHEFEKEVVDHPTTEVSELLLQNNILQKLREAISDELDEFYGDEKRWPNIRCIPNEYEVMPGQTSLVLLLENGDYTMENLQTAGDLTLSLESVELGSDSVQSKIKIQEKLQAGENGRIPVYVQIDLSLMEGDSFSLDWSVEYTHITGFNGKPILQKCIKECEEPIFMQIRKNDSTVKNAEAVNPYKEAAGGKPLRDSTMFYGRNEEVNQIWDYIVDTNDELIPGKTLVIYGQKKCGKTSLINQIKNKIQENEKVCKQAIVIHFNSILSECVASMDLSCFSMNFYEFFLRKLEREICLSEQHADLCELMAEADLEIPELTENLVDTYRAPMSFNNFMEEFKALDGGKHKIILIMDEFTSLCTKISQLIKSGHPEAENYRTIPDFIKAFSEMGFIQIIIGHAAMMSAFEYLGVINHTSEFAKKIEISALKEEEAKRLICEPMEQAFGYNPYNTTLGERAIALLQEVSGCSPSWLMKLCDQMFRYYLDEVKGKQIHEGDVKGMIKEYVRSLRTDDFDMLLPEGMDEVGDIIARKPYVFLKYVAQEILRSPEKKVSVNIVCPALGEEDSKRIMNELRKRNVFSAPEEGKVKIRVGLFNEFIRNYDGGC